MVNFLKKSSNLGLGVILAIIAIICSSSILGFVNLYEDVPIAMIGVWRYTLNFLYLTPVSIYLWRKNRSMLNYKEIFTWKTLMEITLAGVLYCSASTLSLAASRDTLYSHVIVICNSGGVLIIILNLILLIPVHKFEIIGTAAVALGIIILISDTKSEKTEGETHIIWGDFLCLLCVPFYTLAYVFNGRAIKKIPSMIVFH